MLEIITNNFLDIRNGWTVAEKCDTAVPYAETHLFPKFLENPRTHRNACNSLVCSKNTHPLNDKGIDKSTENISDIADNNRS